VLQYSIYGLGLLSDTALPELERLASVKPDINVRLRVDGHAGPRTARWFLSSTLPGGDHLALCGKIEGGYLLRYLGLADFLIDRLGRELRCARIEPGTSPETLRHLLLDRVLPLVLNLLGRDVLHATAVLTPAGVCAFMGPSGAGKSTLAASLAAVGYAPYCDDCLSVRLSTDVLATPGYPGVRLRHDSFAALGNQRDEPGRMAGYNSKYRTLSTLGPIPTTLHPLIAMYRVQRPADGDAPLIAPRVEPLAGREAFLELVSSAYVMNVADSETLLRHFHLIEQLMARVRIRRLLVPNDFALLPAVRRTILADLSEI
jgi:hypothetical protein